MGDHGIKRFWCAFNKEDVALAQLGVWQRGAGAAMGANDASHHGLVVGCGMQFGDGEADGSRLWEDTGFGGVVLDLDGAIKAGLLTLAFGQEAVADGQKDHADHG